MLLIKKSDATFGCFRSSLGCCYNSGSVGHTACNMIRNEVAGSKFGEGDDYRGCMPGETKGGGQRQSVRPGRGRRLRGKTTAICGGQAGSRRGELEAGGRVDESVYSGGLG